MLMISKAVIYIFFALIFLLISQGNEINAQLHNSDVTERYESGTSYKVLKEKCFDSGGCIAIVYCAPDLFNHDAMTSIGESLAKRYDGKKTVNVNIFDRLDLAQAYVNGVRHLSSFQGERRGWLLINEKHKFLMYFPDPTDQSKHSSIDLSNADPNPPRH